MELKLVCNCGQKYKFDVEPVNRQMPFVVNCPICGLDGTPFANALLAQSSSQAVGVGAATPPPIPPPAPAPPRAMPTPASRPSGAMTPAAPAIPKYLQNNPATANNNFMLGILGAFLGAIVGVAVMFGFFYLTGLKLPLTGTLVGACIGFGARLMYRGTSSSLGFVCAALAFVTISVSLFLMFGLLGALLSGVISILVGCAIAFRVAS